MKHTEDFKREAVRIALSSGLSRTRIAADLGIGKSPLGKWIENYRPTGPTSGPQGDLARENERLRLENRILREEREILKKSYPVLREPEAMRFAFIHGHRHEWPIERLCRVLQVSARGYPAWTWRCGCMIRRPAAFSTLIVAASTAFMISRKSCWPMGCWLQCPERETVLTTLLSKQFSKV